jgi:flavin reductase (DIM6/NTAB) family NADH-FMN oxidoreductase RutF
VAYPLPVFLVGTYDQEGQPDVMVAAWGGICSSDPPSIAVSIRPSRQTYRNLMAKKEFTVSIPSDAITAMADFTGIASGADIDKFARTGLTPERAEKVDAPGVKECPVVLECRVTAVHDLGAHTQFVGEILDVKIDPSVISPDGKPDLAKIRPLGFDVVRSEYFVPGKLVGKAFSDGKRFL